MLDVTNLYINAVNHDYDVCSFLEQLPLEQVVQLHFVGGHWHDGVLIDSHSHSTPLEVWKLMDEILSRAPAKGVVLERDENLLPFSQLTAEFEQAVEISRQYQRWN